MIHNTAPSHTCLDRGARVRLVLKAQQRLNVRFGQIEQQRQHTVVQQTRVHGAIGG
jgi:hypothetical protein